VIRDAQVPLLFGGTCRVNPTKGHQGAVYVVQQTLRIAGNWHQRTVYVVQQTLHITGNLHGIVMERLAIFSGYGRLYGWGM